MFESQSVEYKYVECIVPVIFIPVFWISLPLYSNEDDLTMRLLLIINCNNQLRACLETGQPSEKTMVFSETLKLHWF